MTDKQREVLSDLPKLFEDRADIELDSLEMRVVVPDDATSEGLKVAAIWNYTTEEARRSFPDLPEHLSEWDTRPLAGIAAWMIGHDGSVANLHGEQERWHAEIGPGG